jgi:hemoglobin
MSSLFERVGGMAAVNSAVDLFYEKLMTDHSVRSFFTTSNMKKQNGKLKSFLVYAFGGSSQYSEKSLREAHAPSVEKGLNFSHFDCVADHLQATLVELKLSDDIINEIMTLVASTKEDVLGL